MVHIPEYVPARARRLWQRMREYYNPANDPECDRGFDFFGDVGCAIYSGEEPLLDEIDKVGMIMQEMRCTFARKFLEEGALVDRRDDLETIERAVAVMMTVYHGKLLRDAGVLPSDRRLDPGNEREAVRRAYGFWHDKLVVPLLDCLARRREGNVAWYRDLMNDEAPAIDRGTRVPQLFMWIVWRSGVYGSAATMREIMRKAVRMHEAYKPECLREGDGLLGPGHIAGPARMALFMEQRLGFENFLRVGRHGQFVIGMMQAKDGLDELNGRTPEGCAEFRTVRDADLPTTEDDGRFQLAAGDDGMGEARLAIGEVRSALDGSELAGLLEGVLRAFDAAAESDPETATCLAGELTKIVTLVRSISEPALQAGTFSAWVRGTAYRGRISREAIAHAFAVSVATVRSQEKRARTGLKPLGRL